MLEPTEKVTIGVLNLSYTFIEYRILYSVMKIFPKNIILKNQELKLKVQIRSTCNK